MSKDYAKYVNKTTKRPLAKRGWRKRLMLVCLLLAGILGCGGYYAYRYHGVTQALLSDMPWVNQLKVFFIQKENKSRNTKVTQKNNEEDGEADIQFSFYTDLSAVQVIAPPTEMTAPTPKLVAEKKVPVVALPQGVDGKYLLQIAAFRNPTAAGEMRISLLLAGFEVEIVKAIHKNELIYQLQQGPFVNGEEAKAMQKQLQKKGIESVIVKKIS